MVDKVDAVKKLKVGDSFKCPVCGKNLIKKTYQHTFCGRKCKDKYWNTVDESKRNNINRISKARELYMKKLGFPDYKQAVENKNLRDLIDII